MMMKMCKTFGIIGRGRVMNKTRFQKFKNVLLYIFFAVSFLFLTSSFVIEDVYSAADHLSMDEAGISDVYAISVGIPGEKFPLEEESGEKEKKVEIKTDSGDVIVITEYTIGDISDEILDFQKILYNLGFMTVEPSKQLTEEVQTAIKTYQAMKGLDQTGNFDRSTIISLVAEDVKFELGDTSPVLKAYHEILVKENLLKEEDVSGNFDEKTETAIKEFQKANNLQENGKIDAKTMKALDALR